MDSADVEYWLSEAFALQRIYVDCIHWMDKTMQHIEATCRFGVLAETWKGEQEATSLRPHFHEELQIVLSEHRLVSYVIDGTKITSPLGTLFVIEPGLVHEANVHEYQPCWGELRTLLVPRSCFLSYFSGFAGKLIFDTPVCADFRLMRLFRRAHDLLVFGDDLAAESSLTDALGQLMERTRSGCGVRSLRRSGAMRRMREHLESSLSSPLSLSEIAREIGFSPYHLNREFRQSFGLPPHAYRTQLRILRGRDLLLANRPISEVAQATGFADQAHFTRTFQRIMGVPPGRYQKRKIVQD